MYQPTAVPTDPAQLPAYLSRELQALAQSLQASEPFLLIQTLNAPPAKPRDGQIVKADGVNFNPGSGAGYYGYRSGSWRYLENTSGAVYTPGLKFNDLRNSQYLVLRSVGGM